MCKSIEGLNGRTGKFVDWVRWVAQVALLPILGIALWGWWNHEERIDAIALAQHAIQSNRFTSADGLEVWREIAEIRADLDSKADHMGAEPVREDIVELKERVHRIEERMNGGGT